MSVVSLAAWGPRAPEAQPVAELGDRAGSHVVVAHATNVIRSLGTGQAVTQLAIECAGCPAGSHHAHIRRFL